MGGRQVVCKGSNCSVLTTQNPNDGLISYMPRELVGMEALWHPSQTGREFQIYK